MLGAARGTIILEHDLYWFWKKKLELFPVIICLDHVRRSNLLQNVCLKQVYFGVFIRYYKQTEFFFSFQFPPHHYPCNRHHCCQMTFLAILARDRIISPVMITSSWFMPRQLLLLHTSSSQKHTLSVKSSCTAVVLSILQNRLLECILVFQATFLF